MIEPMATSVSVFRKVTMGSLCICAAACGGGDGNDGIGSDAQEQSAPTLAPGNTRPITPEEYAAWNAHQAALGAVPGGHDEAPSSTEQALAVAAASDPDELIPLSLALEDPEFDFGRLAGTDDATRAAIIAERKRQLE